MARPRTLHQCPGIDGKACPRSFFNLKQKNTHCNVCREKLRTVLRVPGRNYFLEPKSEKIKQARDYFLSLGDGHEPTAEEYKVIAKRLEQPISSVEKVFWRWVVLPQWRKDRERERKNDRSKKIVSESR